MTVNIQDGSWIPIPLYDGKYLINSQGEVCNSKGHIIKPIKTSTGYYIELHMLGQRDRISIKDLLLAVGGTQHESS